MSYFTDIKPDDLSARLWGVWRMTAYFPRDDQLPTVAKALGVEPMDGSTFTRQAQLLFTELTKPSRLPGLLAVAHDLGLDPSLVDQSVHGVDRRARGDLGLEGLQLRAFLGALHWAYLDDLRRRGRRLGEHAVARPAFEPGVLEQRFGLKGTILLGDGLTKFGRPGDGAPSLIARWLSKPSDVWAPQTDPLIQSLPDRELEEWLGWSMWAQGWIRLGMRKEQGRSVWNGPLVRLVDVTQVDDENSHEILMQPTTYVAQMATTFLWRDWEGLARDVEQAPKRRDMVRTLDQMVADNQARIEELDAQAQDRELTAEQRAKNEDEVRRLRRDILDLQEASARLRDETFPRSGLQAVAARRYRALQAAYREHRLRDSRLANALSTNVAIVSTDRWLYLQRRNSAKVGEGIVDWQTTGAGFVNPEKDLDNLGRPSVWRGMSREAREEFGRELWAPALGIFWEGYKYEVGIVALARSEKARRDIHVPAVETTEVLGFRATPFDPAAVLGLATAEFDPETPAGEPPRKAGALRRGAALEAWANVMPLGAASVIFALVHDDGGSEDSWDRLARLFRTLNGRR